MKKSVVQKVFLWFPKKLTDTGRRSWLSSVYEVSGEKVKTCYFKGYQEATSRADAIELLGEVTDYFKDILELAKSIGLTGE